MQAFVQAAQANRSRKDEPASSSKPIRALAQGQELPWRALRREISARCVPSWGGTGAIAAAPHPSPYYMRRIQTRYAELTEKNSHSRRRGRAC